MKLVLLALLDLRKDRFGEAEVAELTRDKKHPATPVSAVVNTYWYPGGAADGRLTEVIP